MSKLDDEIRKALTESETPYDLEKEEGVFRQMAGLFRKNVWWMAILAVFYGIAVIVLGVFAAIEFFQADDTKWQIFYATSVLLLGMLLMLVKLWGWMQMNRYALQRDIKRLELRMLERTEQQRE